jgi:hypothetical protein
VPRVNVEHIYALMLSQVKTLYLYKKEVKTLLYPHNKSSMFLDQSLHYTTSMFF